MKTINTIDTQAIEAVNVSTFIRTVTDSIYRTKLLNEVQSVALTQCLSDAVVDLCDVETYVEIVGALFEDAQVAVGSRDPLNKTLNNVPFNRNFDVLEVLAKAKLVVDGELSESFARLIKELKTPYHNNVVGGEFNRRFKKDFDKSSPLTQYAIQALEATEFTVDEYMVKVANHVFNVMRKYDGSFLLNEDKYVLDSCFYTISQGNQVSFAEFKPDWRTRLYHASCHGANGQSGDMARSFQSFANMSTDYDAIAVRKCLLLEMGDMVKGKVKKAVNVLKQVGATNFIFGVLSAKDAPSHDQFGNAIEYAVDFQGVKVKKPWSFVKFAKLLIALEKHIDDEAQPKPVIDVAVGLDAKGSGPQLAALTVGDHNIARACGFTFEDAEFVTDVYALATSMLVKRGFDSFERDLMKAAYMPVYYGQSWQAFADLNNYGAGGTMPKELLTYIAEMDKSREMEDNPNNCPDIESRNMTILKDNAKIFHECIEQSFGAVTRLRDSIKAIHGRYVDDSLEFFTQSVETMSYQLPDGQVVKYKNFMQTDILGEPVNKAKEAVYFEVNGNKHYAFAFQSDIVDQSYQRRTGFVNLVQSVDALLARLIIANLRDLGATHIVSVHDCFRVNVIDYCNGLLNEAIKLAYLQIFTDTACRWFDGETLEEGVHNRDILALYFRGVHNAYTNKGILEDGTRLQAPVRQFTNKGTRLRTKINGETYTHWIENLENKMTDTKGSYFFTK